MEFKGTKGEWCVNGKKYPTIVSKNNNKNIIVTYSTIATVNSTFRTIEESQANAKLIASAPDLLEALQELLETCPCDPDITTEFWQANQKSKQAIEKALK